MLLATIDKFDPNMVLININKIKPYWTIENSTLKPNIVNPNDLLIKEPVEEETNDLLIKKSIENELGYLLFVMSPK